MKEVVLVLGCGPAGLFAAHAATCYGYGVIVVSKKRKSDLFGCQYLHEPIPLLTAAVPGQPVAYTLRGEAEDYRQKVYGDRRVQVSPEDLLGTHDAWDLRETYDEAWQRYSHMINDVPITSGHVIPDLINDVTEVVKDGGGTLAHVVSSIPAPALCVNEAHTFTTEQVWAMGDAPERGQRIPFDVADFHVVCNGEESPRWYRAARVYGMGTVEWPDGPKPPYEGVVQVKKPLATTCDCHADILRVGRYGRWQKGILSHEAYEDVVTLLTGSGEPIWS